MKTLNRSVLILLTVLLSVALAATTQFDAVIIGAPAGVKLSGDGDGAITFLGLGNGSDEDLTLNLDDTSNTIVATSSTGVTVFNFSGMEVQRDGSGLWRDQLVWLENQQTSGTAGGTATLGAWRTATINTEVADAAGLAGAISSNEWTLAAGTYRAKLLQPVLNTSITAIRLYNVTDAAVLIGPGQGSGSGAGEQQNVTANGEFTLAATKTVRLEYYSLATTATHGLGYPMSIGTEHYAAVYLWRK